MDHVENKRIYSEMHDAKNFNRNRLDEIEEIRRKYVNKLGKDCPAKKDEFLGLFSNSKLEKLHIKKKRHSAYYCFECLSIYHDQLK